MAKYILVKKVKGKKYEYQVIDADSKAIVSKRTSAREYVACTADGSFYFGRLDLIGKGDQDRKTVEPCDGNIGKPGKGV